MKLKEIKEYFHPNLFEMSTFLDKRTGLMPGTKLWVRDEPTGLPHSKYRIKVSHPQKGDAVFAIWGDEPHHIAGNWVPSGKDLRQIQMLIRLTHNEIRSLIDGQIDTGDLIEVFLVVKDQVKNA